MTQIETLFFGYAFQALSNKYIINVCLVYLCTAIVLIIPNFLFPHAVRIAHLMEMSSSMLVFGFITGMILWEKAEAKE
ncbi:hypothetical protein FACS189483_06300 [Spirochaetia bacterium]|nr:hypothetical protein FACS189483_06300 [Spirochaetia bacterium]